MNFGSRKSLDDTEINLIPFIDVLLVVLIFLMLSTTFTRLTELEVQLPTSRAEEMAPRAQDIVVTIASDGRYSVNRQPVEGRDTAALVLALRQAAQGSAPEPTVVIAADAMATHQSVIAAMDAARQSGLARLAFTTQPPSSP